MIGWMGYFQDRGLARAAWIALLAIAFVVMGTGGRYLGDPQARVAVAQAPSMPTEAPGEAPHLGETPLAAFTDAQARHRQAGARKAGAARKGLRGPAPLAHIAALNGAAFAVAAAIGARVRPAADRVPSALRAAPGAARAPPLLG